MDVSEKGLPWCRPGEGIPFLRRAKTLEELSQAVRCTAPSYKWGAGILQKGKFEWLTSRRFAPPLAPWNGARTSRATSAIEAAWAVGPMRMRCSPFPHNQRYVPECPSPLCRTFARYKYFCVRRRTHSVRLFCRVIQRVSITILGI